MYNRRLTSVAELQEHVEYSISVAAPDGSTTLFLELFKVRLNQYLIGAGHPDHPDIIGGVVSEQNFRKERDNPILRACLLLVAATDTDLMPMLSNWSIEVCT